MKVRELKEVLERADGDQDVKICVETPDGFVCPDGCAINVKYAMAQGIDWHSRDTLLIPEFDLKMTDSSFNVWSGKKEKRV